MYLFKLVSLCSSDIYPETELWNHILVIFLIFCRTTILFSIVAVPICISTNSVPVFPFLHLLTTFVIWCLSAESS